MANSWLPVWSLPERSRIEITAMKSCLFVLFIFAFSRFLTHVVGSLPGWNGTFTPNKGLDVTGLTAAVACDIPECSQMGIKVLQDGGNAADAAVQVALCVGSMAPQSSGIGGGGFITVRYPNGTAFVIDARETAPRGSSKHMFDTDPISSKYSGLASGVPGEIAGLGCLWQKVGRKSWSELILPVAALNDIGFEAGEALEHTKTVFKDTIKSYNFDRIMNGSDWCWLFGEHPSCSPRSKFHRRQSRIRRPKLAETLRLLASEGPQAFYHGAIPESLVQITKKLGGILSVEDFSNYTVIIRPALEGHFNGYHFVTASAPTSGPALVMGLKVMEELQARSNKNVDPLVLAHRRVEILKWMAAARSELGDPDFIYNPKIDKMIETEWVQRVVGNISDSHTLGSWRNYHPSYEINNPKGTTHFSIVDGDGLAVSMTTTVNLPFGNGICDPNTGIIMNSEMDDFSIPSRRNFFGLEPSIYNFVEPGKRPLSSSAPVILYNDTGHVQLVIGAAGGSRILTAVFLAISQMYGEPHLSGLEAVSFPRFHHQLIPESLSVESGFPSSFIKSMEAKGHTVVQEDVLKSVLNLVHRDSDGVWHAISDFYRKRGMGAAY